MTSTTSTAPRCHVALELSQAKWLVGVLLPGRAKVALYIVRGGDAEGLAALLNKVAARASAEARQAVSISVCFEIGYDGFWLARFLLARGIDTHVLDASSFLVSRRGRRAKTDRIDVEAMAFTLKAYLAGDRSVCRTVEVPTPEAEDAKRLSRERTQLTRERTRHVNRIRGLLTLHGIRAVKGLFGGAWREALDALVIGDGHALGPFLRAELAREFERLHLVLDHVRQLDAERRAATAAATAFRDAPKVERLVTLAGIGEIGATVLVAEVFHRSFQNRKHLASYLGLTPSPYTSVRAAASRASARPATRRRVPCSSNSPGAGCATSRAAGWPIGTAAPMGLKVRGCARLASSRWLASWRSRSGGLWSRASCRPGPC